MAVCACIVGIVAICAWMSSKYLCLCCGDLRLHAEHAISDWCGTCCLMVLFEWCSYISGSAFVADLGVLRREPRAGISVSAAMTALACIPQACIDEVGPLVIADERVKGVVNKWSDIDAALERHGYIYVAKNVSIDHVLTHADNRSKLMLSPTGAHSTGAFIKGVGVKKALLEENALAFELCPMEPAKSFQLTKNTDLVSQSNGLLKPVVGDERFLSVGASHATAFFRAAKHGCKTPEKELQDDTGCIDVANWSKKQPDLAVIINDGFDLRVVRWEPCTIWPNLPDIASRAKNSAGAVQSARPELEVLANIALLAETAHTNNLEVDWKSCVAEATAMRASCNAWAEVLGMYARLYAGGPDAPLIYALDNSVKRKFAFRNMGEELWKVVAFSKYGQFTPRVMFRQAIIGAIMTCTPGKVRDGFCRALAPSDVSRLSSKKLADKVDAAETMMKEARTITKNNPIYDMLVHELDWRLIYHMCEKGKYSWDCREFKSFEDIFKNFVIDCQDLSGGVGCIAMPEKYAASSAPTEVKPDDAPAPARTVAVSASDVESPEWVVAQKGFKVDAVVSYVDPTIDRKSFWKISDINPTNMTCTLNELVPFGKVRTLPDMDLKLLPDEFKVFGGKLQSQIDGEWRSTLTAMSRDASSTDMMRSVVYIALQKLERRYSPLYKKLMLLDSPRDLRAVDKINKGELTLVPAAPLRLISVTKGTSAASVRVCVALTTDADATELWVQPNTSLPKLEQKENWLNPFWWVNTAPPLEETDINMKLCYVEETVDGVTLSLPVLINSVVIKQHGRVCMKGQQKVVAASIVANAKSKPAPKPSSVRSSPY